MDAVNAVINDINNLAWGPPMLILLGITGIYLTVGLNFFFFF